MSECFLRGVGSDRRTGFARKLEGYGRRMWGTSMQNPQKFGLRPDVLSVITAVFEVPDFPGGPGLALVLREDCDVGQWLGEYTDDLAAKRVVLVAGPGSREPCVQVGRKLARAVADVRVIRAPDNGVVERWVRGELESLYELLRSTPPDSTQTLMVARPVASNPVDPPAQECDRQLPLTDRAGMTSVQKPETSTTASVQRGAGQQRQPAARCRPVQQDGEPPLIDLARSTDVQARGSRNARTGRLKQQAAGRQSVAQRRPAGSRSFDQRGSRVVTSTEVSSFVRDNIPGAHLRGGEWRAPCPLHGGRRDSFAVHAETGAWFCHSECGRGGSLLELVRELTGRDPASANEQRGILVAEYDYTDEHGALLFQVVRFDPKDFRQRQPDGAGWKWNVRGVRLVPYRLPQILQSARVIIVEGEKRRQRRATGIHGDVQPNGGGQVARGILTALRGQACCYLSR